MLQSVLASYVFAYDAIRTQTVMIKEIIVASVHLLEPRFCFTTKTELVDGHHAGNPKSIEEFYKRPYSLNSSTLYQTGIDYPCCVYSLDNSHQTVVQSCSFRTIPTVGNRRSVKRQRVPVLRNSDNCRLVALHPPTHDKNTKVHVFFLADTLPGTLNKNKIDRMETIFIEWPMMISNALELLRKNSAGQHIH